MTKIAAGTTENNAGEAVEFLQRYDRFGRHNLVAIDPNSGAITGKTFTAGDWSGVKEWVESRNGRLNLYFSVNEPSQDAPHGKLDATHIASIRAIPGDVDPERGVPLDKERKRLLALAGKLNASAAPPSFVTDSGGGIQPFWRLKAKRPASEYGAGARDQGRGIAAMLDGDSVFDTARIMRLPGTWNVPDADKSARGRTKCKATVLSWPNHEYTPEALAAAIKPLQAEDVGDNSAHIEEVRRALDMGAVKTASAGIGEALASRFRAACADNRKLVALWQGDESGLVNEDGNGDTSGSQWRWSLASHLHRAGGFTCQDYGELLWSWAHALSPSDQDQDRKLSSRQIARAWVRAGAKFDPSRWFDPIPETAVNPFEVQHQAQATEREARRDPARFRFTSFGDAAEEALSDFTPPLIDGLLDQGAMSVLYGDSNAGKTFIALDMAYSIWQGVPYGGLPTTQTGVAYIAAEGGRGIKKRLRALENERRPASRPGFDILTCPVNLGAKEMRTTLAFSGVNEAAIEDDFSPDPPNPEETFDVQLVIDDLTRFAAGCDRFYNLSVGVSRLRSHYARTRIPHYMRRRLQAAVLRAERAAPVVLPGFNPVIIENGFRALFVLASLWGDEKDETGPRPRLPPNPSDPTGAFRAAADGWARILQNSAHSMSLAQGIMADGAWDSVAWLPAPERV